MSDNYMSNHSIDCRVCGDDMRGDGNPQCKWGMCPGFVADVKDLQEIAAEHPDAEMRETAARLLKREQEHKQYQAGTAEAYRALWHSEPPNA
jgi:hypothetical protein